MDLSNELKISLLLPSNIEVAHACSEITGLTPHTTLGPEHKHVDSTSSAQHNGKENNLASLDRDFVCHGESTNIFLLVGPAESLANRFSEYTRMDVIDMCRSWEVLAIATGFSVSNAMLCPIQPPVSGPWYPGVASSDTNTISDKVKLLMRDVCAVYFLKIFIPELQKVGPDNSYDSLSLNIQCRVRLHSAASPTLLKSAQGYVCDNRVEKALDFQYFPRICEQAISQDPNVMSSIERCGVKDSVSSLNLQISRHFPKVDIMSIQSRFVQTDNKCFVEVIFENIHKQLEVELRSATLRMRTPKDIHYTVSHVGRWYLPVRLIPGNKQSICFEISDLSSRVGADLSTLQGCRFSSLL